MIPARAVAVKNIKTVAERISNMENKICQSCAMPLTSDDLLGTNKDGTINHLRPPLLGCSQVVRHKTLTLAFAGPIPATPTI